MSETKLKLGSLFSGIGGFELVGSWYGIEPVWASEVEPACIRITSKHFPNMNHIGDITKIHGDKIEPVDVLTGGSPCQDLSAAGKQSGIKLKCENCGTLVEFADDMQNCPKCGTELEFTRSGLFMEQIRIIREMREKTNECYPKVVIWENVSGALSSNNGDDFFCVLQEFCKLVGERIPSFRPEKWTNAGEILGESCSIAWRTLDAQYWGVPQRRRRIFLVADFTGQSAGEILFKPESLRRHITPCKVPWKRFAAKTEKGVGTASGDRTTAGGNSVTSTLTACYGSKWNGNAGAYNGDNFVFDKPSDSIICVATQQANAEIMIDKCPTLTAANGTSGSNKPYVVLDEPEKPLAFEPGAASRLGGHVWEGIAGTLTSQMGDNQMAVVTESESTVYGLCSVSSNSMKSDNPDSGIYETDKSKTLDTNGLNPTCNQGGNIVVEEPVYCIQGNCIDRADTAGCNGKGWKKDVSYTLTTVDRPAVAYTEQVENADPYVAAFAYQQGGSMPVLPYGEKISPPLLSCQKTAVLIENHSQDCRWSEVKDDVCPTLTAAMGTGGNNTPFVIENPSEDNGDKKPLTMTCGCWSQVNEDKAPTLSARDYKDPPIVVKPKSIVRRLTPLECERLQGFYDNWTEGESDSARYKALGNSVALPCVDYIMSGVADMLDIE
ncbi:MAG: DNA cytosine methyltransferase [Clostridium sp.]|nr:DNA cytosine methyltransferase [Clostridium sp.]